MPAAALPEVENKDAMEEKIARMAAGDKNALAELYNEAKKPVFGFALSILKNTEDAEDVLQETFIRVWRGAAGYVPRGKPMAWLLTVTRNLALSRLRERARVADIPEETWQLFYVESPAVTHEDRLVLQAAMTALSESERQVVTLHALTGLKHAEIAEIMGLPLSTVLSKYSRARGKLESILKEGSI